MQFIIIHRASCEGGAFHYRIDIEGRIVSERPETESGQHPNCIGVALDGPLDDEAPSQAQLDALRSLTVELKIRYPSVRIGGHRQVRGEDTACPGKKFPLRDLLQWTRTGLIEQRDGALSDEVERQYRPR